MKRSILSVVVGLVTAVMIFLIAESINSLIHPVSANLDFNDEIAVRTFYEHQPLSFWLIVLAGWIFGSLMCGLLIKWIGNNDNKKLPIIAGSILTLSAIANFLLLPHPTWFIVVGILVFIPSTLLGHNLFKSNTNGHS